MQSLITSARIEKQIHIIRGQSVILDSDLAKLYLVPTKVLIQAVKRNSKRFPSDFMFQLSLNEDRFLKSQIVTSRWGGRRFLPFAFTEQGVAMLSSVLNSQRAIQVNIEIMRAFVRLRGFQFNYAALRRELGAMRKKYDARFSQIFHRLEQLFVTPEKKINVKGFVRPT